MGTAGGFVAFVSALTVESVLGNCCCAGKEILLENEVLSVCIRYQNLGCTSMQSVNALQYCTFSNGQRCRMYE